MNITINIKPLSVNECWQGKRFKTPEYKKYERDMLYLLPAIEVPEKNIALFIEFGFSSNNADIDNGVKPFLDILQKRYGFNDRYVTLLMVKKRIVEKGKEYIMFLITEDEETR